MPATIRAMKRLLISLSLAFSLLLGIAPVAMAKYVADPSGGGTNAPTATPPPAASPCPDGQIQLSSPLSTGANCVDASKPGGPIFVYLAMIIKFLSGAVGLVIVLMIVISGVQYITSTGDPARVKEAKTRITNAITGLVLFVLMFALLNFLIPGGIIN